MTFWVLNMKSFLMLEGPWFCVIYLIYIYLLFFSGACVEKDA